MSPNPGVSIKVILLPFNFTLYSAISLVTEENLPTAAIFLSAK
jgi:hypothetical protein